MMYQQEINGCDVAAAVFGFGRESVCTNSGFLKQVSVDGKLIYNWIMNYFSSDLWKFIHTMSPWSL